jgi:hypothetical protein
MSFVLSVKRKNMPETIHTGVLTIARLGGFLGRKVDKEPGVKTLRIGIRRFTDIIQGWQMAKQKDVGNG